ncbi:MAG: hypothetical protein Q8O42_11795 [Acidobacteriota bacterium]|nr:hypothetical protein [Acidobacteriota bacterium]
MRRACTVSAFAIVIALTAGCGVTQQQQPGRKSHAAARILVKKDGDGNCKSKTIPRNHMLLKNDENEVVWDIKVKDGCLANAELVLKWIDPARNPTACAEVSTTANGNKSKIRCDLDTYALNTRYEYQVYLRKAGAADDPIEDPDVEIVEF